MNNLNSIEKGITNAVNNKKHLISVAMIFALATQVNSAAAVWAKYHGNSTTMDLINAYVFAIAMELFVFVCVKYGQTRLAWVGAVASVGINIIHTGLPKNNDIFTFDYIGCLFLDFIVPALIMSYTLMMENKIKPEARKAVVKVVKKKVKKAVKTQKQPVPSYDGQLLAVN